MTDGQHTIGRGRVATHSGERHTDRYGLLYLVDDSASSDRPHLVDLDLGEYAGRLGALYAEVVGPGLDVGGDEKASVGDVVRLGDGELFTESAGRNSGVDVMGVGVQPTNGRETNWMDPMALYRVRHRPVRLFFTPAD
ncbi:hypothetical protein [Micromonospora sp. NPDC005652]|uniref:hypothetical protein n=1 Tax=Micromonospora sp. NPDC005652 TaxID=3157046 RepID=UPI00340B469F